VHTLLLAHLLPFEAPEYHGLLFWMQSVSSSSGRPSADMAVDGDPMKS
jgi:hypothetical protein